MLKRLTGFAAFVLCLSLSQLAGADPIVTERGGGNVSGGSLGDDAENAGTVPMVQQDVELAVYNDIKSFTDDLPVLAEAILEAINDKSWLLEPKAFDPTLCPFDSMVDVPHTPVACQNDIEVRISTNYWNSSTDDQKTDLVLHEALTGIQLANHLDAANTRRLVRDMQAVRAGKMTTAQLRLEAYTTGFGWFLLGNENTQMKSLISGYLTKACSLAQTDFANQLQDIINNDVGQFSADTVTEEFHVTLVNGLQGAITNKALACANVAQYSEMATVPRACLILPPLNEM